jgi:hypothetical protein
LATALKLSRQMMEMMENKKAPSTASSSTAVFKSPAARGSIATMLPGRAAIGAPIDDADDVRLSQASAMAQAYTD